MENKISSVFSKVVKAGKKRTYFFDVRNTKGNDYFLTITESRKRINGDGYEKNKIFLYKEDFNKFLEAMKETVDHVKTELLPDFDFDSFNRRDSDDEHFTPRSDRENEGGETNFAPSRSQSSYDNDGGAEKLHREKPEEESPSNTSRLFQDDEAEKW